MVNEFKCPNLNSEFMMTVENELGGLGAYQVLKALNVAQTHNDFNFDATKVKYWAGVKLDRAKRLLPYLLKYFKKEG